MKQEEAKRKILSLWAQRKRHELTQLDILGFYGWLGKEHPELLNFRVSGDQYQKIKGWILPYVVE